MYALAIDAGSSSVRAALYDHQGVLVPGSLSQIDVELTVSAGGVVEIDATMLRQAVERVIDITLQRPEASGISSVGMTTFWHSLVVLDRRGEPLTPVLTWADTRSEPEALMLRDRLDGHAVHQRTGCILHPSYLPAKMLWLHRDDPGLAVRAGMYVSFAQYCTSVWLGTTATSVSMASGSGLFNHAACAWDEELTSALGVAPSALGAFLPDPELLPPVTAEYAARWPALAGVGWRAPIGDGAASNVGSGCVDADLLALMVGTSGALRSCAPEGAGLMPVPDGLWRYRLDRRYAVTGGALSDGGNVYEWLRETLLLPDEDALERELAAREPGQHGLIVLPFWSGERSLGWVGDATALFAGLKHHTSALDLFQAALEAVAYRFAALYDALQTGGETIVASGGGLRESPAWLQMMADAIGQPLVASGAHEASLRGAALVALRDSGAITGLPRVAGGTRFTPRLDRYERHLAARRQQQTLYEREIGPRGVNLLARQTRG